MHIVTYMLCALVMLAAPQAHAIGRYTVTATGAQGDASAELSINDAGAIAGSAFIFSGGRLIDLGRLGGYDTEVSGINDSGTLTGTIYPGFARAEPYVYQRGVMTPLGTQGANTGYAYGINKRGMVVGMIDTSPFDYPNLYAYGFLYADGVMRALPTLGGRRSAAYDINDAGIAVGTADWAAGRGASAVRYEQETVTPLGSLPGSDASVAYAINDRGNAAGYAQVQLAEGYYNTRAVAFVDGNVIDLGLLGNSTANSVAYDINNSGEVVGTESSSSGVSAGFLFSDGQLVDLNALLTQSAWRITAARAINDQHQIAAWGCNDVGCQALLLDPAPISEPRAWLLLLCGLGLIRVQYGRHRQPSRATACQRTKGIHRSSPAVQTGAALRAQCDINTGSVIERSSVRVTPPSASSRQRM